MALSVATLASELLSLTPTDDAALAAARIAEAYDVYVLESESNGNHALSTGGAKAAMAAVMSFSTAGDGAAQIVAGLNLYWGTMSPVTLYAGCSGFTPPTFAGLQSLLEAVFASNRDGELSLSAAMLALAEEIHAATDEQGEAVFTGVGTFPIT